MFMHSKSRNLALLLHNSNYVVDASAGLEEFKGSKVIFSQKVRNSTAPFWKAVQKINHSWNYMSAFCLQFCCGGDIIVKNSPY